MFLNNETTNTVLPQMWDMSKGRKMTQREWN